MPTTAPPPRRCMSWHLLIFFAPRFHIFCRTSPIELNRPVPHDSAKCHLPNGCQRFLSTDSNLSFFRSGVLRFFLFLVALPFQYRKNYIAIVKRGDACHYISKIITIVSTSSVKASRPKVHRNAYPFINNPQASVFERPCLVVEVASLSTVDDATPGAHKYSMHISIG